LETQIDEMNNVLSPMTHFILPGGHHIVSHCHIARTVCRRAERNVCGLAKTATINSEIIPILNRLSDYLFVLARKLAHELNVEEIKWIPKK
jgi:cob(I)alamin adenosyltransferase